LAGAALLLAAVGLVGGKTWLALDGPYLEALAPYPYCAEAARALAAERHADAMELAEAGACEEVAAAAEAEWNRLSAVFGRCVDGIWTGRGEDAYGIGCAVASDLVVFGDVRDLTRQGVAWLRGEETDEVLVALSSAGVALTLAPHLGAGTALLKAARRAGALGERFAKGVVRLARERAWGALGALLGDAGRIGRKLPPGRAARVLAYADDPADVAALARFVEAVPHPALGLKWGGKAVTRLADEGLYAEALMRGPAGLDLALRRGARALLRRQPLVVALAKAVYGNAAAAWRLVPFLVKRATWPWVGGVAAALALVGLLMSRPGGRRRGAAGRGGAGRGGAGRAVSGRAVSGRAVSGRAVSGRAAASGGRRANA